MLWTMRIISFLREIGIPVKEQGLENDCFLPGIEIQGGSLIVDRSRLMYPGDLLHEAGHIAVMTPEERASSSGDLNASDIPVHTLDGYELSAIAWSYAAACHLEMPIEVLFHANGYKNDSEMLISNYNSGNYLFTPLLQYWGLCKLGPQRAADDESCYPKMKKWLRD
ncbi:hypothetical protein [Sphingobacterium yanglingense]|uniref:Uncharacterized protein n=1 Tax=Sphingobacterium yanglingense TaxID=1437280 RepID=A0A4R6W954_9SPHI|nr:hypothetical protein [Sphingobacterium yanglingense]TDQ73709.1 hypothetical protein CLV99_4146 [Sphingobacterium yanglingense]